MPGPGGVPGPGRGGVWRPPPEMATAAGGTHPTGMHSYFCLIPSGHLLKINDL